MSRYSHLSPFEFAGFSPRTKKPNSQYSDEKRKQLMGLVLVVNTCRFVYFSGFISGISQKAVGVASTPLPEDT